MRTDWPEYYRDQKVLMKRQNRFVLSIKHNFIYFASSPHVENGKSAQSVSQKFEEDVKWVIL